MIKKEPEIFINIVNEVIKPPFQLLQSLLKYKYEFVNVKFPCERFTDEDPPIILKKRLK